MEMYFDSADHMAWVINGIGYILAFPQISSSPLCVDPVQNKLLLRLAFQTLTTFFLCN